MYVYVCLECLGEGIEESKTVCESVIRVYESTVMFHVAAKHFYINEGSLTLILLSFLQVQKLTKNEVLMVNIGSLSTGGRVSAVKADLAKIALTQSVCTEVGEKIVLSRRVEKHWR